MFQALYNLYALIGWISYILLFILGLVLGSFLNSWIWRTRENIKIMAFSRSICFHCRRQLHWYENIPLFSFIFLKRKCPSCHNHIPWRYPAVEAGTAVLLVLVAWYHVAFLPTFNFWWWLRDVFFLTVLIIIFVYDLLYQEVITGLVWLGIFVGFLFNYYYHGYSVDSMVIGAAVGAGFFGLQYAISRGKWVGGGDVHIGFLMGVWLGWPGVLLALFAAYLLGAAYGVWALATKRAELKTAVPFGTFLAVGTFFALYYGEPAMQWYLNLVHY